MSEPPLRVTWRDSRRLTGPNLLLDGSGAALEAHWVAGREDRLVEAWRAKAGVILAAIGWPTALLAARPFPGGAILAIGAPLDSLYSATLINEWACEAAEAELAGDAPSPLDSAVAAIEREIRYERDPALLALAAAAQRQSVAFVATPVDSATLAGYRGGERVSNEMTLNGTTADNSARHVNTGDNTISSGSFSNMSGLPVVIQNSGANVLIQNAVILHLQMN